MASFYDILTEIVDTDYANQQLKKVEDEVEKVKADASKDPTLSAKVAGLSTIPQQLQGLKAWLEQQKNVGDQETTEKKEQQKKFGSGVGTQTSINKPTPPVVGQQLKPPTQAEVPKKAIDILKTRNLTK